MEGAYYLGLQGVGAGAHGVVAHLGEAPAICSGGAGGGRRGLPGPIHRAKQVAPNHRSSHSHFSRNRSLFKMASPFTNSRTPCSKGLWMGHGEGAAACAGLWPPAFPPQGASAFRSAADLHQRPQRHGLPLWVGRPAARPSPVFVLSLFTISVGS